MIQRIQSIFLLLAVLVMGLMVFLPIADLINSSGTNYIFRSNGLYEMIGGKEKLLELSLPLTILVLLNALLPFIAIFIYKRRVLQMRMCLLNIILLLVTLGMIAFYVAVSFSKIQANVHYRLVALMPVIAIILTVMAYNGIRKDEKLVKSVDRIR